MVLEQGLSHVWIWVLTEDGTMRRRVLVQLDKLLNDDTRVGNDPIALQFRISIANLGTTDMAAAFAPSTSVRAASPQ